MKSLGMAHGAVALVTCAMLGLSGSGRWAQLNPIPQSLAAAASFSDPLCELACELVDLLCGTTTNYGVVQLTEGFIGEVDPGTWELLEPLIVVSMAELDSIFDPNQLPSLDPYDAGTEVPPIKFYSMSTEQMGDEACEAAKEAKDEICNAADPDHEYVGRLWHRLRWLLDDLAAQADPS